MEELLKECWENNDVVGVPFLFGYMKSHFLSYNHDSMTKDEFIEMLKSWKEVQDDMKKLKGVKE